MQTELVEAMKNGWFFKNSLMHSFVHGGLNPTAKYDGVFSDKMNQLLNPNKIADFIAEKVDPSSYYANDGKVLYKPEFTNFLASGIERILTQL